MLDFIKRLIYVWKVSKKPRWSEIKEIIYVTLTFSFIIGLYGFIIFVAINLILNNI